MKNFNSDNINRGLISGSYGKCGPPEEKFLFLNSSESGRFIVVADTENYFVLEKLHRNHRDNTGTFLVRCAEEIGQKDADHIFRKFEWEEDCGLVRMIFAEVPREYSYSREFIYDEELYGRTARPFSVSAETLEIEACNGMIFECSIQNNTLSKALPQRIKALLTTDFKRIFKDGVFRFEEYLFLEKNASDFIYADADFSVSFGSIYNPQHLYRIICEAYGVDKNSNSNFRLVFSTNENGAMTLKTTMEESR